MNKYQINKILVPVDFSPLAENAIETAVAMSKRQLSTITLIHVVANTFQPFPPEAVGYSASLTQDLIKDANRNLERMAKDYRIMHDVVVDHIVQCGNAADEICREALRAGIDLIVMGTKGASGLSEFFLGSTAYRVVKNAPCPVLTLPADQKWDQFSRILLPIRNVSHALDKYEAVLPILRQNGSSLLVTGLVKGNNVKAQTNVEILLNAIKEQAAVDRVDCQAEIHFTENEAKHLLEISDVAQPDLIVITATLDSSLRDFFLGPYTQDVVNHAKYPVLSIKPDFDVSTSEVFKSLEKTVTRRKSA